MKRIEGLGSAREAAKVDITASWTRDGGLCVPETCDADAFDVVIHHAGNNWGLSEQDLALKNNELCAITLNCD